MTRRTTIAIGLAVLAATLPAAALARDFTLWGGGGSNHHFTGEVDPVLRDRTGSGSALRFGVEVIEGLNVEADWARELGDSPLFGASRTELAVDHVGLAARYRLKILRWFETYARVGGGFTTGTLALRDSRGYSREDRAYSGFVAGGLGFEVMIPRTVFRPDTSTSRLRDFTVGFAFEVGWRHAFGLDWTLPGGPSPVEGVRGPDVDLGRLVLSGLTVTGMLTLHL